MQAQVLAAFITDRTSVCGRTETVDAAGGRADAGGRGGATCADAGPRGDALGEAGEVSLSDVRADVDAPVVIYCSSE